MAVLVREPYRCTFIHIPKNGGNTITDWLQKNCKAVVTKRNQHCKKAQAERLLEEDLGFTYCTVRNPWDWCVSWYSFKIYLADAYIKEVEHNPKLLNTKPKYNLEQQRNIKKNLESMGFENWLKKFSRISTPLDMNINGSFC